MTSTEQCRYVEATRPPGFPVCSGPIAWRMDWKGGTHFYCEAHGSAHASMSPFAGYERVKA